MEYLQHASYIGAWCKSMCDHRTMVASAASAAQRATEYLFDRAKDLDGNEIATGHSIEK